ncbi:MAG: hypothetical protein Q8S33_22540 [Myxococcales bacterium]|nr:hypothetical protein [Myxococcales bacterium]
MRLALVLLLLAFPALAQKPSLIRVAPFEDSRLGGLRLMKDGAELDLGFFSEEAPRFFQGCEVCADELSRVKGLRITGLVLGIAGPLLMLTGLVVGLAAGALFPILPIALLGGAVISIGGVLFNQLGETFLLRAVNLYNLQLLEPPKRAPGFSGPAGNSSP